jgi:cyclohexanecarboxylate-CoA ligase
VRGGFDTAPARRDGARYRAQGWWRDATFLDDLQAAVRATPGKPAIVAARAFAKDVTEVTYAELGAHVDRFAAGLVELGVEPQDIVAIQLPSWWQYNALALACARIGAVIAPIPVDYRRREAEFVLSRTGAGVYIGPASWLGFSHQQMLREMAPALPALRHRVLLGAGPDRQPAELDFDACFTPGHARRHPPAELDRRAPGADDVFLVMFTSGTTGEPKGVVHSYNTLYAITRALQVTAALEAGDIITTPSGVTGLVGFLYDFLLPLLCGATAVYADLGDPERGLQLIEDHGVTFLYAIPTYVLGLVTAQQRRPRRIAALRTVVTGSAPVPPHLVAVARDSLGVTVQSLWGMTEAGGVTFTMPDDPPDWPSRSDGRPIPWMEIQIVEDPAAGEPGAGRLRMRGANQCLGYFQRPEVYAESVDGDGWFDTGDLVRPDGRGGIRIIGRIKDVIVRNGQKVPVVEVESALVSHPKVAAVALIPDPDHQLGERVCAVAVARDDPPTLGELREHLRALGMSPQYWPDRLHVIGEMPLTSSGKIQKFVLQDQLRRDATAAGVASNPGAATIRGS